MEQREGASISFWHATWHPSALPVLDRDEHAEVCVVGAGIAGLTVAYELAKAGRSVVVLDARGLGDGQTGRTSGHVCSAIDDRFHELARLHGAEGSREAARSHAEAVDTIERICHEEAIDCGFTRVDGYLVLGDDPPARDELERELEGARAAGLDVERVDAAPGAFGVFGPALRFPRQAQFHALRYLEGLARAARRHGARIYGHTHVRAVHGGDDACVETARGPQVHAQAVVVATNTPFNDRVTIHTKQYAYRTYVMTFELPDSGVPEALLWDTLDPYHYVRTVRDDARLWLMVGGEDRKVGQDDDPCARWKTLERWARRHFPMAGEVGHRWSGQVYEPADSLAFIGRNPGLHDNVFIVTGDSGNGLTHGTIAGRLIAQAIAGHDDSAAHALYAPNRRNLHSAGEYFKENANMVAQYRELVTAGEVDSGDEVAPGEGRIVRDGLGKHAVFRDDDGTLHVHSAVCPHLGAVVQWNAAECSWDCPAHGSRFDARDGRCLNGPAARGLGSIDDTRIPAPGIRAKPRPGIEPRPPR